jgi:spermidine dehydrogenase
MFRCSPQTAHLLDAGEDDRARLARGADHEGTVLPTGPVNQEQGDRGRAEILDTSFRQYELQLREQLTEMFGASGFDARRDIAGIILNRWGHAYGSPQPGFFFGKNGRSAPRDILRQSSFGRIAFANTDLSGDPNHQTAITEAERAAGQLLDGALRA